MPKIKPVSDLRNYGEVLSEVGDGSPVFLTKNGKGRYALLTMRDYDRMVAELELATKLATARRKKDDSLD
jgi:antitoxin Phd